MVSAVMLIVSTVPPALSSFCLFFFVYAENDVQPLLLLVLFRVASFLMSGDLLLTDLLLYKGIVEAWKIPGTNSLDSPQ